MSLKGKWRTVEMELWDASYLDMMEPAYILFDDKTGSRSSWWRTCPTRPPSPTI